MFRSVPNRTPVSIGIDRGNEARSIRQAVSDRSRGRAPNVRGYRYSCILSMVIDTIVFVARLTGRE